MSAGRVLAFDVGTSGVKAALLEGHHIVAADVRGYGLRTLPDGWVEQDIGAIRRAMNRAARAVLGGNGTARRDVEAVAITAQMFNLVAVDGSGEPVLPMLSWLDTRAAASHG